ncbi:hypothetical protein SAMN04488062_101300 [Flavobacterium omnivorum]|uniref:Uncharacterized protein n=1 Tax=Flavobacterium omnivorum TaxID=178355 RepID=A0A1G7W3N0_9FLAO|nr:hypothetical protein [Flavobacterium omnivorum]SDG66329.1 hypothetical protein SAMN04488062_101300 [Flavobacterium omnivorum]
MYIKVKIKVQKIVVCVSLFVFSLLSVTANAQCAMCRAALTSEGNTAKAAAVNDGIVYLMVIPYILVAGIGYAIYRMKKNKSS